MKVFIASIVAFMLLGQSTLAAQEFTTKKDLADEWLVFRNNDYNLFQRDDVVSTVYIPVTATQYPGHHLHVSSGKPFVIFINGKLAAEGKDIILNLDSLSAIFSNSLTVAVHQPGIRAGGLVTEIQSRGVLSATSDQLHQRSWFFRDFTILAFLILTVMLIVIIRLNPKLASDYFSVTKIFSLRETEDSQVYLRITSSTNILFYVFCSLMLAYYLLVVFHFIPGRYPISLLFQPHNFWMAMVAWLKLSLFILAIFFFKIIAVYGLTRLFGMNEVAGVHFFNWVRVLLVVFGVMTVLLSMYFIVRGQRENFFALLLQLVSWVLAGWMVLIMLKLRAKLSHSMFHLFSYICATELIPFLITIKVLYT